MIWTLWIQIGQPYRKVLCNKPAPIIASNPGMWDAYFKQKCRPKTPFVRVKCVIHNPAKNSSHKVQKNLRCVQENQTTLYFHFFPRFYPLNTLNAVVTPLLGTFGEKFETFSPKVNKWFELRFLCKICSLRNFFQTLSRRNSEIFPLKFRKSWIIFRQNLFLAKC